ncbi:MAG: transglycosylase SLT domain-containing protein [Alphaproteobacteria bacterium]|nr:transglycosylase SLT domain-containing protein [Alphaproteobacteria bacterium]
MASSRVGRIPHRRQKLQREWHAIRRRLERGRKRLRRAWRKFAALPRVVRIGIVVAAALAVFSAVNLAYHVVRKPTELFFPLGGTLAKTPENAWREYADLFRRYSTKDISPELLAALAEIESDGNPVARTYWRWRFAWNPFGIYAPASTSVGMYQMTDAAFAEARRYCIRDHAVTDDCWFTVLYTRVLPHDAIELAAVYLDRKVAEIRAAQPALSASPRQIQDLAAIVQLCGIVPATNFARRHFRLAAGERCGDEAAATYLARVDAMKRQFLKLAAGR